MTNITIKSNPKPDDIIDYLCAFDSRKKENTSAVIPSHYEAGGSTELSAAILVGTMARNKFVGPFQAAGIKYLDINSHLLKTLPGLVALQLSNYSNSKPNDIALKHFTFKTICDLNEGLLEDSIDDFLSKYRHNYTMIECDPQYPVSKKYEGSNKLLDLDKFQSFFANCRTKLEAAISEKGLRPSDVNNRFKMFRFLAELHKNSTEYSLSHDEDNNLVPGIRITRLTAHVSKQSLLLEQFSDNSIIQDYISRVTKPRSAFTGIMEVSVSDFGKGIIKHFLNSPRGMYYDSEEPSEILSRLILTRLSSKPPDVAGLGMYKVLKAARYLRACISVRTDKFWCVLPFDISNDKILSDTKLLSQAFEDSKSCHVSGTHWQMYWPLVDL